MNFYINNFRKFSGLYRLVLNNEKCTVNFYRSIPKSNVTNYVNYLKLGYNNKFKYSTSVKYVLALNVLSWLGFSEEDDKKESELITTLKRSVLATRREEYEKAEKLLHLALRIAQQQQSEQGITYCYDLMANLAFDRRELDKAEKLFVSVLQRLLSKGTAQDDLKVVHISLKLARICHLKAEDEKAQIGYDWCLNQIKGRTDTESKLLYGVIQDWYAQFLLDKGEVSKSLTHLTEAYNVYSEVNGRNCEQSMLLLNDLAITNWRAGEIQSAENCLLEAVSIGKKLEDQTHVGVVHANLGLIYLEKGIVEQAQTNCNEAWKLGKRHENTESIMQATYCIEQIKEFFKVEKNINFES